MKAFLREPLLHFLLLGVALFLLYDSINPELAESDPQTIVVDRDQLLTYVQYRSRAFDQMRFAERIDSLPKHELQTLIDDYVREEALYREAKALQLDRNDYVTRLRLIQQMEFMMLGFAEAQIHLTEQEIRHYYETHTSEYWVKPKVTFAHVFYSSERHGAARAWALAQVELDKLNRAQVPFEHAQAHGERFLYQASYVAREADEVASHFGSQLQTQLFSLEPGQKAWRGPFLSPHGAHLLLLTHRQSGYLPPFETVRTRVEQQARQSALDARLERSVQSVVQAYSVKVKNDEFVALRVAPAG